MKSRYVFSAILFSSCFSALAQTTDISGTINTYKSVSSIDTTGCNDLITVDTTGILPGDLVLIIQMKGATVDVSNTSSFGSVTDYGAAGNYEFAEVASVSGGQVGIVGALQNNYDIAGYVQMVTVPSYDDAKVIAQLNASDWNGTTGGVLAFFVNDTLYLDANINLDGKGFRGGTVSNNPDGSCGNSGSKYFYNLYQGGSSWIQGGAEKGEGIAELPDIQMGGKGCLANGGGGGNKHNTGGGGGGNYTSGGKGGNEMGGCTQNGNGGIGGVALPYNSNKIFLGGGGGCGDINNGIGTVGTDAGGIIIIRASTIVGNGHTIQSNGLDQNGSIGSIGDGAGGGGAGGTILLDIQDYSGTLSIQADGGDGGDQTASNTYGCFGPGGGGGTGVIWISGTNLPATVTSETLQGVAGLVLNPSFPCYNTTYGAVDGSTSTITYLTNLSLPFALPTATNPPVVDLGNDTTICIGSLLLDANQPLGIFLWSTGATSPSISVNTSGDYWVQVNNGCGIDTDTIKVTFGISTIDLGNDTALCEGLMVLLNASAPNGNYLWQDGSTDSLFLVTATGSYSVVVNDGFCEAADTINVTFLAPPILDIGNDTALCVSTGLMLDAFVNGATYAWQDSSATKNYYVDSVGSFSVTVTVGTCVVSDTIQVDYYPPVQFDLGNDTSICENTALLLDATYPNAASYLWQDGSGGATFNADSAGMYGVIIEDNNDCTGEDYITISTFTVPLIDLGNDTIVCPDVPLVLDATYEGATYLWSTGETISMILAKDTGHYWVEASNVCGSTFDTLVIQYIDCNLSMFVPNAFSPNGDGINDIYKPVISNVSSYQLSIFNRWGQMIFQTSDPDEGWDGKVNSMDEELGVYVYIIKYTATYDPVQKHHQLNGNITLIR